MCISLIIYRLPLISLPDSRYSLKTFALRFMTTVHYTSKRQTHPVIVSRDRHRICARAASRRMSISNPQFVAHNATREGEDILAAEVGVPLGTEKDAFLILRSRTVSAPTPAIVLPSYPVSNAAFLRPTTASRSQSYSSTLLETPHVDRLS
jgi:hypothetical protein